MQATFDRRALLAGAGGALLSTGLARAAEADIFPVVETADGKVRGLVSGGIKVFKGLPYGADTSGRNRFLPPRPVRRWSGVRSALDYGNICPQVPADRTRDYANLIFNDFQPGGMGEDCLVLNLWTPTLDRNAKKPVMVRFHGGGFYGGSSNAPGQDGEMLSRFGDVVVVNVNHRLSAFGFLHPADSGAPAEFAQSGMAGMLDLSAALAWVKENVEAFGGDPGRVMIFGQSGGGAKVSTLMAMPSARGLFHRAAVASGARLRATSREAGKTSTDALLKNLGLTARDMRKLQDIPFTQLLAAQADLEAGARARGQAPSSFGPVLDGVAMPRHPFDPDAPAMTADVPMIISTVLDDRSYRMANFDQTWEGLRTAVQPPRGMTADDLIALYRREDQRASPYIVQARIVSDQGRGSAVTMAERKAAQGRAPAYMYLWTSPSPAYGGRYGATHGVDVGPSMHEVRGALHGPNANSTRLAGELASGLVAFAKAGDPNNPRLPRWEPYEPQRRATMVFADPTTRAENDPRSQFRTLWTAAPAQRAGSDD